MCNNKTKFFNISGLLILSATHVVVFVLCPTTVIVYLKTFMHNYSHKEYTLLL